MLRVYAESPEFNKVLIWQQIEPEGIIGTQQIAAARMNVTIAEVRLVIA